MKRGCVHLLKSFFISVTKEAKLRFQVNSGSSELWLPKYQKFKRNIGIADYQMTGAAFYQDKEGLGSVHSKTRGRLINIKDFQITWTRVLRVIIKSKPSSKYKAMRSLGPLSHIHSCTRTSWRIGLASRSR
ncbi:hypothetical protein NDU88_003261 [Pleurodeles waltl]|uniref:Uncharacterized protein n=1 Tax=Pleurodeles waltl TaxID=8319 RepID=A0AAV7QC70_PLEWA|nr:hypothetical protein NDU88_003261 [Pleurodeles waltl]